MAYPQLYFGPMSKNIVDSVIAAANEAFITFGLIASRRQVDYSGGYVRGWRTSLFYEYVQNHTDLIFICRDHGGPGQGVNGLTNGVDGGRKSLKTDMAYMDIVHIDPWKFIGEDDFKAGCDHTISLLKYCYSINPDVHYEIGTEEAIYPYTPEQLDYLISTIKESVNADLFSNIQYASIQSGVGLDLLNRRNTGKFNKSLFDDFVNVCLENDIQSKEHNGDFLNNKSIRTRFDGGLGGLNIAPELATIESEFIWNHLIENERYELLEEFFILCRDYASWHKWIGEDYNMKTADKKQFTIAFGHYIYNHERFKALKESANINDYLIKIVLKEYILDLYEATGKKDYSF